MYMKKKKHFSSLKISLGSLSLLGFYLVVDFTVLIHRAN